MKLICTPATRIPTEKARGIQRMKMCQAFAKEGLEVDLICPQRSNLPRLPKFKNCL